jgi:hypothetical protein
MMINASAILSEAQFAMEHVGRLKHLARHRPSGRAFKRRVRTLEEAASRLELEAKALSVRQWRAQPYKFCSPMSLVEFSEIDYLDGHR